MFPNKVLKKIGKFSLCEIIQKRLKKSKLTNKIIFAIPNNKKNRKLFKHLNTINANVYLGSEKNVLEKNFLAAKKYKAKNIIRITGDCPLIEGRLIDEMINKFKKGKYDYVIMQTTSFSDGFDIEIFNLNL